MGKCGVPMNRIKSQMTYTVYVLKSAESHFHYIGHTINLPDRLRRHNRGQVRSTKAYRPLTSIYTEDYPTKSAAQQREYYLKRGEGNLWLRDYLQAQGVW